MFVRPPQPLPTSTILLGASNVLKTMPLLVGRIDRGARHIARARASRKFRRGVGTPADVRRRERPTWARRPALSPHGHETSTARF